MKLLVGTAAVLILLTGCGSAQNDSFTPPPTQPSSASAPTAAVSATRQLVAIDDLPTGWAKSPDPKAIGSSLPPCFTSAASSKAAQSTGSTSFVVGRNAPYFHESVNQFISPAKATANFDSVQKRLDACRKIRFKVNKTLVIGTMTVTSYPAVGDRSRAYTANLTLGGAEYTVYVVAARNGRSVAMMAGGLIGTGAITAFSTVITAAATKLRP